MDQRPAGVGQGVPGVEVDGLAVVLGRALVLAQPVADAAPVEVGEG